MNASDRNDEFKQRTKDFARRCRRLAFSLPNSTLARHITGQLIRCSTSVAANYRAACLAQSRSSFIAKISIVLEEADESAYWIEPMMEDDLIKPELAKPLLDEAYQLVAIFAKSRITAQSNKG